MAFVAQDTGVPSRLNMSVADFVYGDGDFGFARACRRLSGPGLGGDAVQGVPPMIRA